MSTQAKSSPLFDLPKISKKEVQLNNLFYAHFFFPQNKEQLTSIVGKALQSLLQSPVILTIDHVTFQKPNLYLESLPSHNCISVMTFPPQKGIFLLDMPVDLATTIIYRILGKEETVQTDSQEITQVEQGIFTFGILKLLNALQADSDQNGHFEVIKIVQDAQAIASYLPGDSPVALINFKLIINQKTFFFKVVISSELLFSLAATQNKDAQASLTLGKKRAFAVQLPIIANVGEISLNTGDFASLDIDDIIIFESSQCQLKAPGLVGDVHCKIGDQEFGSFKASLLITKSGRYALQIKELIAALNLNSQAPH